MESIFMETKTKRDCRNDPPTGEPKAEVDAQIKIKLVGINGQHSEKNILGENATFPFPKHQKRQWETGRQ
jgi:hypothetical protein